MCGGWGGGVDERPEQLCGDVSRGGDRDELAQDVLGRLQVVLGDHQGFLDVLDGIALGYQAFDLTVQGLVPTGDSSATGRGRRRKRRR